MSKVLVTGSTGFIGKALIIKLLTSEHEILELKRHSGDISDKSTWDLQKADVVIHLAARTFVPDSWADPQGFLQTNFQGTVCALEYCRKHNATLIFLSSYMYGKPVSLPIPETAILNAFNPYALSKKLAEEACAFYAKHFNIGVTILRPFNVYGPEQQSDFLIPYIIRQALSSNVIKVKDLEPKRDYVFIDDLVDFIIRSMDHNNKSNVFNVGTGHSYSVSEIIELIQKNLGTNLPVESESERRPEEVMDTQADISKAFSILGWKPKWTIERGITKILEGLKNETGKDTI